MVPDLGVSYGGGAELAGSNAVASMPWKKPKLSRHKLLVEAYIVAPVVHGGLLRPPGGLDSRFV